MLYFGALAICLALFFGATATAIKEDKAGVVPEIILASQPCPSGWNYVSQTDTCYLIPKTFLPWSDAQTYCRNVTGGDLVSVYSQFEYDTVLNLMRAQEFSFLYPFWLGLEPSTSYPYWRWQDQHTPNFTKWMNSSRPDSSANPCVGWKATNGDGWQSYNCKYAQPFICKQHSQNCPTLVINGTSGNITSPNYPNQYDLSANCIYHINVPTGYVVKLTFNEMDIDELADIFIYDGPTLASDLIGDIYFDCYWWYCWSLSYTTTETAMTVQFKTSTWMYEEATGWTASFKAVEAPIPTMLNGTSGSLTSPNYPLNYTNGDTEYYKIFAPPNHKIIITIWDFVTEAGYDWLQIFDGEYANVGTPLLDWAGNKAALCPRVITTTTNAASLVWYTDYGLAYKGYNLTWVADNYFG